MLQRPGTSAKGYKLLLKKDLIRIDPVGLIPEARPPTSLV